MKQPRWTLVALLAANLVPLFGVLIGGWTVLSVLLVYSLENVVVFFFALLRMLSARCESDPSSSGGPLASRVGMVLVGIFMYGGAAFLHLLFVLVFFSSSEMLRNPGSGPVPDAPSYDQAEATSWAGVGIAFLMLWVHHGVDYVRNYLEKREFEKVTVMQEFGRPFLRIAILQIVIVVGAFLVLETGVGVAPLLVLVVLKTGLDLAIYTHRRRKREPA